MEINWECPNADRILIDAITKRAISLAKNISSKKHSTFARIDLQMDITACHCNGMPLRLAALLDASDFNFAHDVFGIQKHINRDTGTLNNCFVPRYKA